MESIEEFYAGRSVFITGGTGFMGKVLIEKLLRSCPDVKRIYILVRDKYGLSAQERWDKCTKLDLFTRLKKELPGNLENKVFVLKGSVDLDKFGITDQEYQNLIEDVSVIIHSAASIRFVEPIKNAFQNNMFGTKNVLDFALLVKNLKVFVHVSTAYSNSHLDETYENMYKPIADYRSLMKVVKKIDPIELDILTAKCIYPMVNTYIFTKHLSEQMVNDYKEKLPIVIFRPSIVACSASEPFPGWLDNLCGPFGLGIALENGVLRCQYVDPDTKFPFVPVDTAIKALIVASWKKGISNKNKNEIDIYNATNPDHKCITNHEFGFVGLEVATEDPCPGCIWYPTVSFTTNKTIYRVQSFFVHFLPAFFIDMCLRLTNQKEMLLKIQIQLMSLSMVLSPFTLKQMKFKNGNYISLNHEIPVKSKKDFDFDLEDLDVRQFIKHGALYAMKFFFNRNPENSKAAKIKMQRFYWLDRALKWFSLFCLVYFSLQWLF